MGAARSSDSSHKVPLGSPFDHEAHEHMSLLAEGFPCLVGKPGVRPWEPDRLDRWARDGGVTGSQLFAARFVLNVCDGNRLWKCGRFNLLHALDHWDEQHRTAFVSWVMDPWWPLSPHSTPASPSSSRDSSVPEEV